MGVSRISWADLYYWQAVTGNTLSEDELKMIRGLDERYLLIMRENQDSK